MSDTLPNKDQTEAADDKAKPIEMPLATLSEVFSFAETFKTKLYIALGLFFAMIAGFAMPASIFYFSRVLGDISAVTEEGLDPVLNIVYSMMILGVVSLFSETLESTFQIKSSMYPRLLLSQKHSLSDTVLFPKVVSWKLLPMT